MLIGGGNTSDCWENWRMCVSFVIGEVIRRKGANACCGCFLIRSVLQVCFHELRNPCCLSDIYRASRLSYSEHRGCPGYVLKLPCQARTMKETPCRMSVRRGNNKVLIWNSPLSVWVTQSRRWKDNIKVDCREIFVWKYVLNWWWVSVADVCMAILFSIKVGSSVASEELHFSVKISWALAQEWVDLWDFMNTVMNSWIPETVRNIVTTLVTKRWRHEVYFIIFFR